MPHVRLSAGFRPGNRLDRYAAGLRRWLSSISGWRPQMTAGCAPLSLNGATVGWRSLDYWAELLHRDYIRFSLDPSQMFGKVTHLPNAEHSIPGGRAIQPV